VALHRVAIERDIQEFENATRFRSVVAATPERSDACEQLVESERLHEVVVGTSVEPVDPIANGGASGQHEDGDLIAGSPKAAADLDAIESRKAEVEDHCVVLIAHREVQAGWTLARQVGFVAGAAECALYRVPDRWLVFDQKDTHLCRVYERVR
jgi:hypothetical protein